MSSDDDEAREHLRTRVGLYFKVLIAIYAVQYGFVVMIVTAMGIPEELLRPRRWVHAGVVVLLVLAWLFTRRAQRSKRALALADVLATLAAATGVGVFAYLSPERLVIEDATLALALTQTFFARAAIVPSSAARTLAVGFAGAVPLAAALLLAALALPAQGPVSPRVLVIEPLVWLTVSVCLTGLTSHVIYGLRRQVRHLARLGQYTLGEKLGEGGMGVVYRASHAMLRRPAALKLLPPDRAGARAIARFEREVQLTATLRHPNTVAIYDYGRTPEGVFYYVMEYLDGMDLDALVRADGPQQPGRVVHIMRQVAGALAEAHGAGLVHRDIKPANIVLSERGSAGDLATVLDFGLVRDLSQRTDLSQADDTVGTPLYLSPEAISAPDSVDARSDCYALGAVGYYLLVGEPVFVGHTLIEVCAHHLHTRPVPPSKRTSRTLPPKLEGLVLSCLEKDPGRRPQTAEDLLAALDGLDDVAPWTATSARTWWAGRRRPAAPEAPSELRATLAVDLRDLAGRVSA